MHRFAIPIITLFLIASAASAADDPPTIAREFRGVWVASVSNIDWPSQPGLTSEKQKEELIAILDKAVELKLNAVIFQVRPMGDALYESKLEPWSEYLTGTMGKSPGYDPLALAVEESHKRGLELHAWFNPYRARHPSAKSETTKDHITKTRPDIAKPYGKHHWMNPTHADVQNHSLAVILDVVKRYDIDGIHIDDYFYPYKEKDASGKLIPFPDDDTWEAYKKADGKLTREDWRRDAVNTFVKRMYKETKQAKPWVKVGISPFGIWRPGNPPGITGLDQFAELYADAKLWLNEGWVDYFTPQLYWPIAQEKQSFPKLLEWWTGQNTKHRHLWPGLYTSRVTGADKGWRAKEIADQIAIARKQKESVGVVHFSAKAIVKNTGGIADELAKVYSEPALVPETSWLATAKTELGVPVSSNPPTAPQYKLAERDNKQMLTFTAAPGTRFIVMQTLTGDTWKTAVYNVSLDSTVAVQKPAAKRVVIRSLDRTGRASKSVEVK